MSAVHLVVSGIVQGVGYRWWTRRTAERLGLRGWVRNLDDGRVEIWAEGDSHTIDKLVVLCEEGPTYADVSDVSREDREEGGAVGFSTRPDAASPI